MTMKFQEVLAHANVLWTEDDYGIVTLSFPQTHWIQQFFRRIFRMKIPMVRQIQLDEKTSAVWKLIDGQKTIKEIYDEFMLLYMEESDDLEARFGTVIHYFLSQKWIQVKER